jgi:two-component system, response regulator YesN
MKKWPFDKMNKMYANILLSLVLTVVITIFILSSILYINFESISLYQIYNSEKSSLSQASYSAKIMRDLAKSVAQQIYYDSETARLGYFSASTMDITELNRSIGGLGRYTNTTPFIQSVYVYNSTSNMFYTSARFGGAFFSAASFYDSEIMDILDHYKEYKVLFPIPRKIPVMTNSNETIPTGGYTFLFFENPGNRKRPYSAVIVNISEEWMRDTLRSLNTDTQSNTIIIDRKGTMIISTDKKPMMNDLSRDAYIRKVLSAESNSGYFTADVDGIKSLVIHVTYEPLDWTFVRTIPYADIISHINDLRFKTISIGALILLAGLFVTFLLSRKLYKPIDRVLSKLKILEAEKRNSFHTLKENFLRNIIFGKADYNPDQLEARLKDFNVVLNPHDQFRLILLMIDTYSGFCSRNNQKDRGLIKFAIMNIASEFCSEYYTCESVDTGEGNVLLILCGNNLDSQDSRSTLESAIGKTQEAALQYLEISLSASISSVGYTIRCIKDLYDEALNASYYRLFNGHHCLITAADVLKQTNSEYAYPAQREKALVEALMLGKLQEVTAIYNDMVQYTSNYTYNTLQLAFIHLAFAINTAIDNIEKNCNFYLSYNFSSFINELNRMETLEEINTHFCGLFENIVSKLQERKSTKYDDLVTRIVDIVNQKYPDQNLSIESIADSINMSPAYLGRLFRKLANKSVIDYINEVRIEKAKELLLKTGCPINEIVGQIGYTNCQYFYKVFKKLHGVTPNEFRQSAARTENQD